MSPRDGLDLRRHLRSDPGPDRISWHAEIIAHNREQCSCTLGDRMADSCLQERAVLSNRSAKRLGWRGPERYEEKKMSEHVIVGAGAVGSATAVLLAERGERVRVISRRGTGPQHPAIETVAADATDAERLSKLAVGAVALYNCASPQYHQWLTDWPPLASALLTAAERSGAVLTVMNNLYGY